MNIFIAGCARSGTSLARGLMECFEDVFIYGGYEEDMERLATAFDEFAGRAPFVILKRAAKSYRTLPVLRRDVELIYCVRHPFDVLTSTHAHSQQSQRFHVGRERWLREYVAFRLLRLLQPNRRIFVLRYEDIVGDPDSVQDRLVEHFGLKPKCRFSDNPSGVKLQAESLAKWRRDDDLLAYCASFGPVFRAALRRFGSEFGYDIPDLSDERANPRRRKSPANVPVSPARRLAGNPIVRPRAALPRRGGKFSGPSLIAAPQWSSRRLGKYYLYFIDRRLGLYRLASAEELDGPWSIQSSAAVHFVGLPALRGRIGIPDVHVDQDSRRVRIYASYRPAGVRGQKSVVAFSEDGMRFAEPVELPVGPGFRCVRRGKSWLGMDSEGYFYRSQDGITGFERRPTNELFAMPRGLGLRHVALNLSGDTLEVFYTRSGEIRERIWRSRIDLADDWTTWRTRDIDLVLDPQTKWEGAGIRVRPSRPGPPKRREHALRDPAIFVENGAIYLVYSIAGESGLAIARLLPAPDE